MPLSAQEKRNERSRKYRAAHPEKVEQYAAKRREKRQSQPNVGRGSRFEELGIDVRGVSDILERANKIRRQFAAIGAEFKRHGCSRCPEKDPACLDAHHVDPSTKSFACSQASVDKSILEVMEEYGKCVCLCANCHRKLHAGRFTLEGI